MPDEFPPQVAKLHTALQRLAGVHGTKSGIECVDGVTAEQLSLACFAQLPHGAMRRTGGAISNEVQVQVEFQIEPSAAGWRSLKFLAWWVRDAARGSLPVQLRPFALPPTAVSNVQLGQTLRFHLDYFFTHPDRAIEPILEALSKLADDLDQTIDIYQSSLLERGGPSLLTE
ncbi:MAG: hypothetical protein ABJF10_24800 [Chthoniobacter sp.]|uniref:hypothetical protein n=1 Tax=Chthoniobacter sp. TaxID=2510640 RepID=UPI0032A1AEE9